MGVTLPKPEGQQQDVVFLRASGHCVALGAAGSGKTVMAVNRARYLSEAPGIGGPTLLVTYNGTLVTYLSSRIGREFDVDVLQYHLFAKKCIEERTHKKLQVCDTVERHKLIEQALTEIREGALWRHSTLNRSVKFFVDEFDWLDGHGVTDFGAYLSGELQRTGRGSSLAVADRAVPLRVYERYRELRAAAGYDQDWPGIAGELRRCLAVDDEPPPYRHVVIDEGQDFSPEMIRSLVAAVPEEGSVTFFGDYAQQIYGRRLSWQSLGLQVKGGRTVRFDRNYRNTREIARLATTMADMPHFADGVELVRAGEPAHTGMTPTLVRVRSKDAQLAEAMKYAKNVLYDRRTRAASRRVAVLTRTPEFNDKFFMALTKALESRKKAPPVVRLHKGIRHWIDDPGFYVGQYVDARGLEFDTVIMPLCDEDELPPAEEIEALGSAEARARQARELYVGITRARTELVILYSGALTPLLPAPDSGMYELLDDA